MKDNKAYLVPGVSEAREDNKNAMETDNTPRAYVVHLTPEEVERVRHCTFWYNPESSEWPALSYKVNTDKPLDLDALRLVLEASENYRQILDEDANRFDDMEARKKCDAIGDTIAKLEALT